MVRMTVPSILIEHQGIESLTGPVITDLDLVVHVPSSCCEVAVSPLTALRRRKITRSIKIFNILNLVNVD